MPGTSGEVKGFGKSADAAMTEAADEAAQKISGAMAEKLLEVLDKETSGG